MKRISYWQSGMQSIKKSTVHYTTQGKKHLWSRIRIFLLMCIHPQSCIRMLWNLNSIPHKKNQLSTLINKKVWKSVQSPRCAVVKCALCSGVRSDLSARFKRPQKEKLMLRVSLKLLKNWRNCRQISFRACLPVSPFKIYEFGYISFDSKLVPSVNIFTNCTK